MNISKQHPDSPYTHEEFLFGRAVIAIIAVALIALGIGLTIVDRAGARPFAESEKAMYWLAVDYWGHEPRNCREVELQVATPSNMFPFYLGESDQPPRRPLPIRNLEVCLSKISTTVIDDPYATCLTIVHEVGHLEGLGHSHDPADIMYPYLPDTGGDQLPFCSAEARARYTPQVVKLRNRASAIQDRCQALAIHQRPQARRVGSAAPANANALARCRERVMALLSEAQP